MRYVVMGGGVAGVCCAEELCKLCHDDEVVLVSSYKTLKVNGMICALGRCRLLPAGSHFTCALVQGVGNVVKYTDNLENFESKAKEATAVCQCLARLAQCWSSSLELLSILQL